MPYIHFTDEQKRQANLVDLTEFLRRRGEPLIRSGQELRMEHNHSVTIRDNEWYDHAAERGGGPVSFLKEFYGMDYPDAVMTLLGQNGSPLCAQVDQPREKEKKEFTWHWTTTRPDSRPADGWRASCGSGSCRWTRWYPSSKIGMRICVPAWSRRWRSSNRNKKCFDGGTYA